MDKEFYLNQIPSQHRSKPKFTSWLSCLIDKVEESTVILEKIDSDFDIDNAKGTQLETLGVLIGQPRGVDFVPTDGSSAILSDDLYRTLLKAKSVKNTWKGEVDSLPPVWETLFPGGKILIQDNQDMTMDVAIFGSLPSTVRDMVENGYIVPKPQSVGINYIYYSNSGKPLFGYDLDNEFVAGYDIGEWANTNEISAFGYDQDDKKVQGYDTGSW